MSHAVFQFLILVPKLIFDSSGNSRTLLDDDVVKMVYEHRLQVSNVEVVDVRIQVMIQSEIAAGVFSYASCEATVANSHVTLRSLAWQIFEVSFIVVHRNHVKFLEIVFQKELIGFEKTFRGFQEVVLKVRSPNKRPSVLVNQVFYLYKNIA